MVLRAHPLRPVGWCAADRQSRSLGATRRRTCQRHKTPEASPAGKRSHSTASPRHMCICSEIVQQCSYPAVREWDVATQPATIPSWDWPSRALRPTKPWTLSGGSKSDPNAPRSTPDRLAGPCSTRLTTLWSSPKAAATCAGAPRQLAWPAEIVTVWQPPVAAIDRHR